MAEKIPPPGTITGTTPLRLEVAAKIAFPDGSISVSAMRRLVDSGQLDHERIAGKIFVTLKAISEMRSRCRVPARASTLGERIKIVMTDSTVNMAQAALQQTAAKLKAKVALDHMNRTADELLKKRVAKQYTVKEFCADHAIGRTSFYEEVAAGRLQACKIGKKTVVSAEAAEAWRNNLRKVNLQ